MEQLENENRGLKGQLDEMKIMMKQLMEFQRQQSEQIMMMQQAAYLKQPVAPVAAQPIVSEAAVAQPIAPPPVAPQPADP